MIGTSASLQRFAIAWSCALVAACAATPGGFFGACAPGDIVLPSPALAVPDLPARSRGDIQPTQIDVPTIPAIASRLALELAPSDAPLLAAPHRATLPPRREYPLLELPPSRGAPSLPDASLPVPQLATPFRGELLPATPPVLDIAARTRTLELGERYGPVLDQSLACAPALVLASPPCRLSSRAQLRGAAWPDP
jgi:hypothetical protein